MAVSSFCEFGVARRSALGVRRTGGRRGQLGAMGGREADVQPGEPGA
ncbi:MULTISPECIES: hypothetical protein [Mycobacterium]|nr:MULTISPECIES: hypothetical protein [Mycobacterium]MDP7706907.1 hypothetical protein [Mycobacterium sp. TY815]